MRAATTSGEKHLLQALSFHRGRYVDQRRSPCFQPVDPIVESRAREGRGDIVTTLREMGPALIVNGHDDRRLKCAGGRNRIRRVHGQVHVAERGQFRGAQVEDCYADVREAPGDFGDAVEPDRVA